MWIYIYIYHILSLITIIHHTRHHFITRTTSKHEIVWCWYQINECLFIGSFIKLIKVQFTGTWVKQQNHQCPFQQLQHNLHPTSSKHCSTTLSRKQIRKQGFIIRHAFCRQEEKLFHLLLAATNLQKHTTSLTSIGLVFSISRTHPSAT